VAWQVGQFLVAGAVALALVGAATSVASRRVGEREAIVEARSTTLAAAQGVVEPAVTDALLSGAPAAVAAVDRAVQVSIVQSSMVRVKIWRSDGRIVYSDEDRLIGATYTLGADEQESISTGRIDAEVSDLSKPENRYERGYDKLLEVYLPIRTPVGEPLLFEAYYEYDTVQAAGSRLWRSFAPISLSGLVMLEVVQVPLAWSLARRLRQRQREREGLLKQALEASDVERRRIATDLHDGVVQELAGVAYSLAGAARGPSDRPPINPKETMETSAATVRESIKSLRSLLVEIYPPDLEGEGLDSALSDLLARTSGRGVVAELDTSGVHAHLSGPVAGLLYRAAQEALRNTLNHADATALGMRVTSTEDVAVLEVDDDGRGFDAEAPAADGHVGLKGLRGLLADAGGQLTVRSAPGEGTHIRVEVPLR
jgi:signal transduction histidine kinase